MMPLAATEQLATLRNLLDGSGYTEAEICRRFGIPSLEQFEIEANPEQVTEANDAAGTLVRLFIEGKSLPLASVIRCLGRSGVQCLGDLQLIQEYQAGEIISTIALYPSVGVYVGSDRWGRAEGGPFYGGSDIVYPAMVANAQRFLRHIPSEPCDTFLDLCAGTGVAALHASKNFAHHAFAFDIAERSTAFAEWNRRLNCIPNMTCATGDLFEPARESRFDRIVAHPPYVPVLQPRYVYHDGGEDGEQIIRRIIAGVPGYLQPGGLYYQLAMVSDREDQPFETRVRQWLGDEANDFDVAVFPLNSLDPEDYAVRVVLHSANAPDDLQEFKHLFRELRIRQMIYAVLLVQRRSEPRDVFTIRRQANSRTGIIPMLHALEQQTQMQRPGAVDRLLHSRLLANKGTAMRVQHHLTGGAWEPDEVFLHTQEPFSMEARVDPWAVSLLAMSDGNRTLTEVLTELENAELLPAGTPPDVFARAVSALISGGFLRDG